MSNQTQTLMLGDVDIGEYVKPLIMPLPIPVEEKEKKNKLEDTISHLEKNTLSFEKFFIANLKNELNELQKKELESKLNLSGYPEIDLSFLNKSYDKKVGERKWKTGDGFFSKIENHKEDVYIKVPAFSVYNFYKDNEFTIRYDLHASTLQSERNKYILSIILPKQFHDKNKNDLENEKILSKNLIKSMTSQFKFSYEYESCWYINNEIEKKDLPKELESFVARDSLSLVLKSSFNGMIPTKTKEKVKKSQEYFSKEDIYLIAETKPEEWDVKKVKNDPLVIGMKNDRAYIIDHFNCTPLENLVKDVYVGRGN